MELEQVNVARLCLKLETAVIAAIGKRSIGSPICLQMMESLNHVQRNCAGHMSDRGENAVRVFVAACSGHFLSDFAPLSSLKRFGLKSGWDGLELPNPLIAD